jgi:hypothetical protein
MARIRKFWHYQSLHGRGWAEPLSKVQSVHCLSHFVKRAYCSMGRHPKGQRRNGFVHSKLSMAQTRRLRHGKSSLGRGCAEPLGKAQTVRYRSRAVKHAVWPVGRHPKGQRRSGFVPSKLRLWLSLPHWAHSGWCRHRRRRWCRRCRQLSVMSRRRWRRNSLSLCRKLCLGATCFLSVVFCLASAVTSLSQQLLITCCLLLFFFACLCLLHLLTFVLLSSSVLSWGSSWLVPLSGRVVVFWVGVVIGF